MKRKELAALFDEVSSKCNPVRGMYASPSTERERMISRELKRFREKQLSSRETKSLEKLLTSVLPSHPDADNAPYWYCLLQKHYSPEQIPDYVFTALMRQAQKKIQV